jgi:pimeloyl-ACP methyl ester carboxylesterase
MSRIQQIFKWASIGFVGLIILTFVGGRIYQVVRESADMSRYRAPGELLAVDDRLMHINCIGQGSPTVIFELGVGSSSVAWSDVHKEVSLLTRACAYDRAGLGYSEPTDQPLRSGNAVERLHILLRAAEIEDDLVLVGWSAGGVYIREFYERYPEGIEAMLFVDSSHEQQAHRMPSSSGGGADPMLKIAKRLAPFGFVRMSGILDRRVERGTGSDELKSRLKAVYHQSHILGTVWRESEAFDLDINDKQPPSPIGDLPLIVLTHGNSDGSQEMESARNQLQQELTQLSTNGKQIIATESGHHIYADQPELVIESVEELVLLVREKQQMR